MRSANIGRLLLVGMLTLFCISAMTDVRAQVSDESKVTKENRHVFLLVGQSNMAGRGTVTDTDKQPQDRVQMFTKENAWVPAIDPMHFDKPQLVGVGPGRAFGIAVALANPGITVGLVPCAVGGSPISSWKVGGVHAETRSHPYDDCMRRAKLALETGTLKGILWHQGESDATSQLADAYASELQELMERFRRELKAPDVPILIGQLGQFSAWDDARKRVDAAHRELPNRLSRIVFVTSDGLVDKGDGVHFRTDAAKELGNRYAKAYFELIKSAK